LFRAGRPPAMAPGTWRRRAKLFQEEKRSIPAPCDDMAPATAPVLPSRRISSWAGGLIRLAWTDQAGIHAIDVLISGGRGRSPCWVRWRQLGSPRGAWSPAGASGPVVHLAETAPFQEHIHPRRINSSDSFLHPGWMWMPRDFPRQKKAGLGARRLREIGTNVERGGSTLVGRRPRYRLSLSKTGARRGGRVEIEDPAPRGCTDPTGRRCQGITSE